MLIEMKSHRQLLPPYEADFPASLACEAKAVPHDSVYSTEGFLVGREQQSANGMQPGSWADRLEKPGPLTTALLRKVGLEPAGEASSHRDSIIAAQAMLRSVTWCGSSVDVLARSMIAVNSSGPEFDCSHSDPVLPFSIFISIPRTLDDVSILRLCESILHETMHLQLTLYEESAPLIAVAGEPQTAFSPWRGGPRPLRGVLHGAYVFYSARHWYGCLLANPTSDAAADFINKRIAEITDELSEIRPSDLETDFTELGRELMKAVTMPIPSPAVIY